MTTQTESLKLVPLEPTNNMKSAASQLFAKNPKATPSDYYRVMVDCAKEALAQPEQICGFDVVIDKTMPSNTFKLAQPEQEQSDFHIALLRELADVKTSLVGTQNREATYRQMLSRSEAKQLEQRTWVGLTDEEINQSYADSYKGVPLHESIEARLKRKNT